jgi:hypothetical protein
MRRVTPVIILTLAVGCIETGIQPKDEVPANVQPDILVDPPALQFDSLRDGETQTLDFIVSNVGDAVLEVEDIVIGSGNAFTVLGPDFEFDLEPGEDMPVTVEFTPMGADENYGAAQVLSNDPDGDNSTVDLLGYGLVPDLQITPDNHVFGEAFVPCGDSVELELKNVGEVDLEIYDLDYSSGGQLALRSDLQLPLVLGPDETANVWVDFLPTTSGSDTGTLTVSSNDPVGDETADQNGEGAWVATNSETFYSPGPPPVDVLITIDQSCSMEQDNTDDVEQGFPAFVNELQNVSDWQLILVTDPNGCATGGILDSTSPNPATALTNNAFNSAHDDTLGVNMTESLLKLSERALSKTGPGNCNEGFLRPGALLHIITLSDEPEQSGQSAAYWVGEFENYVTDPSLLKVSGVLDLNNNCGLGAAGYTQAIDLTGGAELNICNSNWGNNFTDIASEVLEGIQTYPLQDPADEATMEVFVNGVATTDWSYEPNSQTVTVNSPPIGENDVVDVNYNILAECN